MLFRSPVFPPHELRRGIEFQCIGFHSSKIQKAVPRNKVLQKKGSKGESPEVFAFHRIFREKNLTFCGADDKIAQCPFLWAFLSRRVRTVRKKEILQKQIV